MCVIRACEAMLGSERDASGSTSALAHIDPSAARARDAASAKERAPPSEASGRHRRWHASRLLSPQRCTSSSGSSSVQPPKACHSAAGFCS